MAVHVYVQVISLRALSGAERGRSQVGPCLMDELETQNMPLPRKKLKDGLLVTLGYMLSPLSWWNDAFLNLPLAFAFAYPFSLVCEDLFVPCMVVGYWLTNILGFVLLHRGASDLVSRNEQRYALKDLFKDISISVAYTLIIVMLAALGILRPPSEYLSL